MRTGTPARPVTPVSIAAAGLDVLVRRVGADTALDAAIGTELRAVADLVTGLDPYVERCTSPESPALAALAARTADHPWPEHGGAVFLEQEMLSGHVEGRFLAMLVHLARARHVLEIGTFTGYATLAMAEALPADGRLVTCELDPGAAALARDGFASSPAGGRIDVRVGPADATLADLARSGTRFDLVFVDADKAGYAGYLDAILDGDLLAPHGVVCVDNTLLQGEPWAVAASANGTAVARFNERLAADDRVEQVLVPLRDGITLIRRIDR